MGGFCLLMEMHREGSAPAASAAGLLKLDGVAPLVTAPGKARCSVNHLNQSTIWGNSVCNRPSPC